MNVFLKKSYLSRLINALNLYNGSEFELFGHCVLERLLGYKVNHRGLTVTGAPSGYTVDSYNDDLSIIGEYSVEDDYFSGGFSKLLKDLDHALKTSQKLMVLYLFTNQLPGPKRSLEARRAINQALSSAGRMVKVVIFDAKMIANYLINNLGEFDSTSDLVINMPELESILNEHIMTNTIPTIKENYLKRHEEEEIVSVLENQEVCLIHGISGIGKTELAISLANRLKGHFEITVWINGKDVSPDTLKSLYVERAGFKQNLIGLFQRRRLLLVIDGLEHQVSEVVKALLTLNKHNSKIIITSQVDDTLLPSESKKLLGFLNEEKAQIMLTNDVDSLCTEAVFAKIYKTIGGHPLLLSIINKLVIYDGVSWEDISQDIMSFPTYEDKNSGQIVLDRLLERHMKSIDREISVLKWLGTQVVSEALLIKLISKIGLNKLKIRDLISSNGINGLRIHDLIYGCISLKISKNDYSSNFESQFITFFKDHLIKKDFHYFRTLHAHKDKLLDMVSRYSEEFALLYASLEHLELNQLEAALEKINIQELLVTDYIYKQDDYFRILAFIDCIEHIHRLKKWNNPKEGVVFAIEQITYLEQLAEIKGLNNEVKFDLKHHLGKFFVFIEDVNKAEACFRHVIENVLDSFHSKLQLSKLIYASKTAEARELLRDIFRTFDGNRQQVSITIILAAFNELRKPEFKEVADEYLFAGTLFEEAISISSVWGFTQPYQVITELGKTIAYLDPKRFIKIMEMIPEPSEESSSDKLLFYSGQLYKELGKCYRQVEGDHSQNSRRAFELSKMFYEKMSSPNSYNLTQISELYQLLGLLPLAISALDKVSIDDRNNSFWHYRYSLLLYEQKELDLALSEVEIAINMIKKPDERFRGAFLYHKAQVLAALDDKTNAMAFYQKAYDSSEGEKFRNAIEAAIRDLSIND